MTARRNAEMSHRPGAGLREMEWPQCRADLILYAKLSLIPADDLELGSTTKAGLAALGPLKALTAFGVLGIGLLFAITLVPRPMPQRFNSSLTSTAPLQEPVTIPTDLVDRETVPTQIDRNSVSEESLATRAGAPAPPAVPNAPADIRVE